MIFLTDLKPGTSEIKNIFYLFRFFFVKSKNKYFRDALADTEMVIKTSCFHPFMYDNVTF